MNPPEEQAAAGGPAILTRPLRPWLPPLVPGPSPLYNRKSREIAPLQPARGGSADRAQHSADAATAAGVSQEESSPTSAHRRTAVFDPGPLDLGAHRGDEPARVDSARAGAGLYRLQLHGAAPRGRPPHHFRASTAGRGAAARVAVRGSERHL